MNIQKLKDGRNFIEEETGKHVAFLEQKENKRYIIIDKAGSRINKYFSYKFLKPIDDMTCQVEDITIHETNT